jgi:hypothetical protein
MAMSLKPKADIPDSSQPSNTAEPVPLLFKCDLEEHRRSPRVKARLERAKALRDDRKV